MVTDDAPLQRPMLWKTPADKPWSTVATFALLAIAAVVYGIAYMRPNWAPPSEAHLIKISGTFPNRQHIGTWPYMFIDDAGIEHRFGKNITLS